ncbi:MAG: phosphoglycerate kinase [Candidatus Babeliales bacterium]
MLNVQKKRVFLRADLNLPRHDLLDTTTHNARMEALVPTIKLLMQGGNKIILATHIGRPSPRHNTHFIDEQLSTKLLVPKLEHYGFKIDFEPDLLQAAKKSVQNVTTILLLENLRFFQGEQEPSRLFAQLLAATADVYINDAFGLIHRNDTSVTLLPNLFTKDNRSAGLIVEKEIATLTALTKEPAQPFMLVVGGCKVKDKIKVLMTFLHAPKHKRASTIIIGGALALPFLKANGYTTGASPCDQADVAVAMDTIKAATAAGVSLVLPTDMKVTSKLGSGTLQTCSVTTIPNDSICVDIGPASLQVFSQQLLNAKTIFANGTMGIYEYPEYQTGTNGILASIAANTGLTILAGGDTVAAAYKENIADRVTFCSTGGGATLAFLGASNPYQEMPALKALYANDTV